MSGPPDTIDQALKRARVPRRSFLKLCTQLMIAAPFGLSLTDRAYAGQVATEIGKARRPSVVWLHFQDCTGCTESLLRTSQPDLGTLVFDILSLDYHETLMAAAGHDAELVLEEAIAANAGRFILVVEGSIPRGRAAEYMTIAGRPAIDVLRSVSKSAAAIIAIGSCASWGGIPSADPNPTNATGVDRIIFDRPIVNIPGCPPNPYTFLAVVLEYAVSGKLPALDEKRRPKFAFDRTIHDHCPRRAHFDAGEFALTFGDEGHRKGHCLYKLGCKGPDTHAPCSTRNFNEVVDAWPIGIGAPCYGCTEQHLAFRKPMFDLIPIHDATPPTTYPPIHAAQGSVDPVATGVVGAVAGALAGATYVAARRLPLAMWKGPPPSAGAEPPPPEPPAPPPSPPDQGKS
jgi:hydrogenase small subunit